MLRTETSKSFRGAFFSPFVRAYVSELANHGIEQEVFLAFVDGLNEAFIAHPIFQGLGMSGMAMTFAHGVPPVQWAGMGLQLASGVTSAATSYVRTRAYVKYQNAQTFHPAGLHACILSTKDMMEKVKYPHAGLQLPPMDNFADISSSIPADPLDESTTQAFDICPDDPRMRRIRALKGYVMPLDLNVPPAIVPDNFLRKMGAAQSERLARSQNKKAAKARREVDKKYDQKSREAEKKRREGDKEIEKRIQKAEKEHAKMEHKLAKERDPRERNEIVIKFGKESLKRERSIEKETAKRDEEVGKEMRHAYKEQDKVKKKEAKTAMKIRWLVISRWNGEDEQTDVAEPDDEDAS